MGNFVVKSEVEEHVEEVNSDILQNEQQVHHEEEEREKEEEQEQEEEQEKEECVFLPLPSHHIPTQLLPNVAAEAIPNPSVSPIGIATAFALLANGAQGVTAEELLRWLKCPDIEYCNKMFSSIRTELNNLSKPEYGVTINMATGIFSNADLQPTFVDIGRDYYQAEVEKMQGIERINQWCSEKTNGQISSLLDQLEPDIRVLIVNALYFRGLFVKPFDKSLTKYATFYGLEEEVAVSMMKQHSETFVYKENQDFQACQLDYGTQDSDLACTIVLPKENSTHLLSLFHSPEQVHSHFLSNFSLRPGMLMMPKFRISFLVNLVQPMKEMGVVSVFDKHSADLSLISLSSEPLYVDKAVHKVVIEVNEEGTEASAATTIHIRPTSVLKTLPPFNMIVDKPFFFFVHTKSSRMILFASQVTQPDSLAPSI